LDPRPLKEAQHYKGVGKLKKKVALITGDEIDSSYVTGEILTLLGSETAAGFLGKLSKRRNLWETIAGVEALEW